VLAEQVRVIRERQMAIQSALEGMRAVFPGVMGGMCRGTVESVDARIEESIDEWGEEVAAIYAELERDRNQW
jgi:Ni,Fe-hydrogenase III large subunit